MSSSISHKSIVILHAIAITVALAIISGHLPIQSLSKVQSSPTSLQLSNRSLLQPHQ